jgi:Cysteine-rich secretory protein family
MKMLTARAIGALLAGSLLIVLAVPAMAETPAEQISSFRAKHGEGKVVRDTTLDGIAMDQARAMAAKDNLSHDALGPFSRRVAPSKAGRAAENIAYGYESFEKTLGQWIDSSEHRKNLLLHNASRVGIASARDPSGKRTYWAMVIAGDYEPKPGKGRGKDKGGRVIAGDPNQGPLVKREVAAPAKRKSGDCRIKLLSLCI